MSMQPDWEERYRSADTGWDIGYISKPIQEYIDQLNKMELKILIPGCGNAYEAAYLWEKGFRNVYLLDIALNPLQKFQSKFPEFAKDQILHEDFFEHHGEYDLILEQTFFCAIEPEQRSAYANKLKSLLRDDGKLVGLLWAVPMNDDHPPYGGSKAEYIDIFKPAFVIEKMEVAYNSIPQRKQRELFVILRKK